MKILVVGKDGKIATALLRVLDGNITATTRRLPLKENEIFLDLDTECQMVGRYDCIVLCAYDFKRGRSDEEQKKRWGTNVNGVINVIKQFPESRIIFLSSYLSYAPTAYGRQKKEVEKYIQKNCGNYYILRIGRIASEEDMDCVVKEITECIKKDMSGIKRVVLNEIRVRND